jgi:hypothetical protein
MKTSIGGSLKATIDRLVGTVAGALWGAVLGAAIPHPGLLATAGLLVLALVPLAALVAGTAAEFLTELADALNRKSAVPPLAPLKQALSEYEDVIAELRRDRLIVPQSAEDAERVFGTAFALQQLVRNLADLIERVGELTAGR